MNIAKWTPFQEFEDFFRTKHSPSLASLMKETDLLSSHWTPAIDFREREGEYILKAELPEIKKEDVKVELKKGVLTISGERKLDKEEEEAKEHRIERYYGSFRRCLKLPENIDEKEVNAEYKDGMLKLTIPKLKKEIPDTFSIKIQ